MIANRYTQAEFPEYNPYSLQELMMAPAYKREKHDAINAGISELETQLAQIDSLPEMTPALEEERNRLYNELEGLSTQLAQEGFNQASKSDFLKFNKDYQLALGPTGRVGQIANAKAQYDIERANLLENAVNMGFSPEGAMNMFNQGYQDYIKKFNETGVIDPFFAPTPPQFHSIEQDLATLSNLMTSNVKDNFQDGSYKIKGTPEGLYVIDSRTGNRVEEENAKQIEQQLNFLQNKWLKEGGAGYKTLNWHNLSPEVAEQMIQAGVGMQAFSKVQDAQKQDFRVIAPSSSSRKGLTGVGFINNLVQGLDSKFVDGNSPLLNTKAYSEAEYTPEGNLIESGKFDTYQEKVNWYKENGYEISQKEGELAVATIRDDGRLALSMGTGLGPTGFSQQNTIVIQKDGNHLKEDLNKMRAENPQLANLNDQELVERLQNFQIKFEKAYSGSTIPIGADFEWMNDQIFGNQAGGGEKSIGRIFNKGVLYNGEELPMDLVLDELGYDSDEYNDFLEQGKPTLKGYMPALGKWLATALNADGEPVNFFVEAPENISILTQDSQNITNAIMAGQAFAKLGPAFNPQGQQIGFKYLVNDYDNPQIVLSTFNVDNISELLTNPIVGQVGYEKHMRDELTNLNANLNYLNMSGIDKTTN